MTITNIEWTERTWNPVLGCTKISEACRHCYAETQAIRLHYIGEVSAWKNPEYMTCVDADGWTGKIELVEHRLDEPDKWPACMIFVPSMGDLFHPGVPFAYVDRVMATVVRNPQHIFQLLTKRPDRMLEYWRTWQEFGFLRVMKLAGKTSFQNPWVDPLPNLWGGCTIENNKAARDRIFYFLKIPLAISFLSLEPLLERVKLQLRPDAENCLACGDIGHQLWECHHTSHRMPSWIIMGGENGQRARPTHPDWFRYTRDETLEARVPTALFFKGWGRWSPDIPTNRKHTFDDGTVVYKHRSRKISGRKLDGVEWNQYPI